MGDFISNLYGKMRLLYTWTRSDGVVFGSFKTYTYGISVNLPMSEVTPF